MQQFSKSDIDLLVEIRQRLKKELGDVVKLSDPNLLNQLLDYSFKTRDAITKSRIRVLFERMGEEWKMKLDKSRPSSTVENSFLS